MSKNVIRQDIVKLDFVVQGLQDLKKLQNEIDDLKKKLTGGVGDDALDDLKDSATKAKKPLEKLKEEAEKVKNKVADIGKKAAVTAFNGLKKVAGISFKALTVSIGAIATAIGGLVVKSVSAYAEFEQLKGGVETLFGTNGAKSVEEYAKQTGKSVDAVKDKFKSLQEAEKIVLSNANNAFKTSGLSANDYMETVTSFSASLINSLKGDTVAAANLADSALVDMADNANKMGTDMSSIQYAYQGFAKQNYTMLDNLKLGYGGTKTEMERLIKDAAKLDKSVKANDMSFGNIVKAIHAVQTNMNISGITYKEYTELVKSGAMTQEDAFKLLGTTAKEANFTITGSLNQVKGAWGNILTAIGSGENLDAAFDNLIESVEIFGNNVMPVAERAMAGIGTVIEKLTPKIAEKLPELAKQLLPPLIKSAVELTKGLINALPSIIKTLFDTVVDICGEQFPIIKKIGNFFSDNANSIAKAIKILIPVVIALAAAFKGFKAVSAITDIFGKSKGKSKGGGKGSEGGLFDNIINTFKGLAKAKPTDILKGMGNLAIIIGGFTLIGAALMAVSPYMAKLTDAGSLIETVGSIAVIGLVGTALAKCSEIVGKISVGTVAKGLANMAIMLGGMSALFLLVGAVSLIKFDIKRILGISLVIGILGTIGAALSVFAGIVGLIPVPVVALGLANMAIVIAGMSALFLLIGATSLLNFDYTRMFQIVKIIGVLGTVGTVLSVFAGIVGMIPIPVVLLGLANMGLVLGGMTALIVAFGALTKVKGFVEFIDKGGEILVKIMNILGEMVGALAGGVIEGISSCLPTLGENLGTFGEKIKPLFAAMSGVDMGGVGKFFTSLVSLLTVAAGNDIVEGIKSFFGGDDESALSKLGTNLTEFATKSKGFFTTVATLPENSFTNATALFKSLAEIKNLPSVGKDGTTGIAAIATDLSTFNEKTSSFFEAVKTYDLTKVNELWTALQGADSVSKDLATKVNDNIDDIIKKVSALPEKMGEGIKKSGESLSNAFVEVWKEAVKASAKPVNKLIEGANWLLKEFGSTKEVITWQPYARGTNGHKGGNALVNDGRGAELVQMPNGRTFIPQGKNVFLPNAPKGMKVLPAEQTAQLMGRKKPSYRYADGTGKIDIWSYYDNAKGLVSKLAEQASYKGLSGFASSLGKGMVTTISNQMTTWVDKLFEEEGGKSLASYVASKGVEQWRSTVARALKMEGQYSAANVKRTLYQMQTESGGNPYAINLWDSNAKKGIPSKGLMQVIDPTFNAYARKGFNKNIYDPLSNILASVRYATSRYGSLEKAYKGVGYSKGVGNVTLPTQTSSVNVAYTPENSFSGGRATINENNTYAPVFNLTINGSMDDRTMERKVKQWIGEKMDEVFESMARKSPRLREV